jgi:hypothetical protein
MRRSLGNSRPRRIRTFKSGSASTSRADPLIGWYDYGSSITLADTESFVIDADPTTGVIQLA